MSSMSAQNLPQNDKNQLNLFQGRYQPNFLEKTRPAKSAKKVGADSPEKIAGQINELYRSFMQTYVRQINNDTLNVTIGGVRIGSAKYSRLAQINLKSRIITFSRFAIENVPERGRRYLVLHELAHVIEASHNKHFWNQVERFEPEYKEIGVALDRAFKKNVQRFEVRQSRQEGQTLEEALRDLNLQGAKNLLWTPEYGIIERNDLKLGLQQDQLQLFTGEVSRSYFDEAFDEYLALRNDDDDTIELRQEAFEERQRKNWEDFMRPDPVLDSKPQPSKDCLDNLNNASDIDLDAWYEDDYSDGSAFGTMSGG